LNRFSDETRSEHDRQRTFIEVTLTPRERDVFVQIVHNRLTNRQIAHRLSLSDPLANGTVHCVTNDGELTHGDIVNLGIGIPMLIADLVTPGDGIILRTENRLLGVGPAPAVGAALTRSR
jgi:hypothetical protein